LEHQTYEKSSWSDEPRNVSDIPCWRMVRAEVARARLRSSSTEKMAAPMLPTGRGLPRSTPPVRQRHQFPPLLPTIPTTPVDPSPPPPPSALPLPHASSSAAPPAGASGLGHVVRPCRRLSFGLILEVVADRG
jgi:hypothetical protein